MRAMQLLSREHKSPARNPALHSIFYCVIMTPFLIFCQHCLFPAALWLMQTPGPSPLHPQQRIICMQSPPTTPQQPTCKIPSWAGQILCSSFSLAFPTSRADDVTALPPIAASPEPNRQTCAPPGLLGVVVLFNPFVLARVVPPSFSPPTPAGAFLGSFSRGLLSAGRVQSLEPGRKGRCASKRASENAQSAFCVAVPAQPVGMKRKGRCLQPWG